jgi:hypothetical protein
VSFFPQILLFDVWRTISEDVEVCDVEGCDSLVLKASGFFSLELAG